MYSFKYIVKSSRLNQLNILTGSQIMNYFRVNSQAQKGQQSYILLSIRTTIKTKRILKDR